MKKLLTNKLVVCISVLVVMLVGLAIAADVVVQEGEIQADIARIGTYLDVDGWMSVSGSIYVDDTLYSDELDVDYGAEVGSDLVVGDELYVMNDIFLTDDAFFGSMLNVTGAGYIHGNTWMYSNLYVNGTFCPYGGVDPPYVLYSSESRQAVVERVQKEVPPEKQGGAALFFDADTRRLEVYVPSEGKFYDLQGNVVHSLPQAVAPTTTYEPVYYFDGRTAQIKSLQKAVSAEEYVLRRGYDFDHRTGQFVHQGTRQAVSKEEALQLYVAAEGAYYDLAGNLLRTEEDPSQVQYVTEYRLDSRTGEVISGRKPIYDRYAVKEGFVLDEDTGEFKDEKTGEVVPKEEAVELIKAADVAAKMTQQ